MIMHRYKFTAINPKTGHKLVYIYFGQTWKHAKAEFEKDNPGVPIISCVRVNPIDGTETQEHD